MILEEMNRRLCAELFGSYPGQWERIGHMAIIGYGQVHMANLCVAMCFSVNGVSASSTARFSARYPVPRLSTCWIQQKFIAITNGITHRRWLMAVPTPALTSLITEAIGDGLRTRRRAADQADALCRRRGLPGEVRPGQAEQQAAPGQSWCKDRQGIDIDTDFIFDTQAKRLHEYKRQLLNALHIQVLYNRIVDDPNLHHAAPRRSSSAPRPPRATCGPSSSSSYINALAELIDKHPARPQDDQRWSSWRTTDVSTAEVLIPATRDQSEQLSTAGKEASGTGNMKFMMNGAVTIGTMDGANVEIYDRGGHGQHLHLRHARRRGGAAISRGQLQPHEHLRNQSGACARPSSQLDGRHPVPR